MKVRIITDSASDLAAPYTELVTVLPMAVTFGETQFLDGVNLSHKKFYELLTQGKELPITSQIPPMQFEEAFQSAREAGETVVAITISSKLSGTYQSACIAAMDFPDGIYVVDSENAAIGEGILVQRALQLAEAGLDGAQITEKLNHEKKEIRLVALLDTLEYLKRGGRLSKSAAAIGGILSIKPVIAVEDGAVAVLGKARGLRNGNNLLTREIEKANGIDFSRPYLLGYTGVSDQLLQQYIADSSTLWKGQTEALPINTIGGTIGTHVGPGAIAAAFFHKQSNGCS